MRVVLLEAYGGVPEVLADLTAKHPMRIPRVGARMAALAQTTAYCAGRMDFMRKIAEATGKEFPLGHFLSAEKHAK